MQIKFWGPDRPHGILSNFAETPLVIDGDSYPTAEHFFQAQKCADPREWRNIILAPTPKLAKQLGREAKLRPNWEEEKCSIMMWGLKEKARQCSQFRQELIDSGDAELIEASPFDYFWGEGRDGSGRNMLGELLMDVRQMIKDEEI